MFENNITLLVKDQNNLYICRVYKNTGVLTLSKTDIPFEDYSLLGYSTV
jgi:hypothetical protein